MIKDRETRLVYSKLHYQKHKKEYKIRAKKKTLETRSKVRAYLLSYLLEHPCVDCGETDPIVLDFDHNSGVVKRFGISNANNLGMSLNSVITEVSKCTIRCSNCHRRKTYKERGYIYKGTCNDADMEKGSLAGPITQTTSESGSESATKS